MNQTCLNLFLFLKSFDVAFKDLITIFILLYRLWLSKHVNPQERRYSRFDYMDIFPRETQGPEGTEPESLETLLKNTNKHNPVPGETCNVHHLTTKFKNKVLIFYWYRLIYLY